MDGFASAASSGTYQVTADVVVGSTKNPGGQAGSPPELALPQAGSTTADNASSPSSTSSFQPLVPAGSDVEVTSNREIIRPMVRRGRKSGSGEDFATVTGPSPLTSPRHNATSDFYPPHLAHQRPVHIRDNHLANRKQVSRPGFSRSLDSIGMRMQSPVVPGHYHGFPLVVGGTGAGSPPISGDSILHSNSSLRLTSRGASLCSSSGDSFKYNRLFTTGYMSRNASMRIPSVSMVSSMALSASESGSVDSSDKAGRSRNQSFDLREGQTSSAFQRVSVQSTLGSLKGPSARLNEVISTLCADIKELNGVSSLDSHVDRERVKGKKLGDERIRAASLRDDFVVKSLMETGKTMSIVRLMQNGNVRGVRGHMLKYPLLRLTGQETVQKGDASYHGNAEGDGGQEAGEMGVGVLESLGRRRRASMATGVKIPDNIMSPDDNKKLLKRTGSVVPSAKKKSSLVKTANSIVASKLVGGSLSPEAHDIVIPKSAYTKSHSIVPRILKAAASHRSETSLYTEEEEEQEAMDSALFGQASFYVSGALLITLVITDCTTALLQLFWGVDDFICAHGGGGMSRGQPRAEIIGVITVTLLLYLVNLVRNVANTDSHGALLVMRHSNRSSLSYISSKTDLMVSLGFVQSVMGFIIEGAIVVFSMVVAWLHFSTCYSFDDQASAGLDYNLTLIKRLHVLVHWLRVVTETYRCLDLRSDLRRSIQTTVSQNKRRFVDPGSNLDLDLTYICDRLLAMSLPCVEGAVYRNDITEVGRFFASRHYSSFMVVNLCEDHEEMGNGNYDFQLLYGQVQRLPFPDHNAPPLHWLVRFCEQVSLWLDSRPDNVVAVHCRGGKGRTGTFCSSLLLWTKTCRTANEALAEFVNRRSDPRKTGPYQGVAGPSQLRYVGYIESLVSDYTLDYRASPTRIIESVALDTMPHYEQEGLMMTFIIQCNGRLVYDHTKVYGMATLQCQPHEEPQSKKWLFPVDDCTVNGDVVIRFYWFPREVAAGGGDAEGYGNDLMGDSTYACVPNPGFGNATIGGRLAKQMCFVTYHTAFELDAESVFERDDVDGAAKKDRLFDKEFKIKVGYSSSAQIKAKSALTSVSEEGVANSPSGALVGTRPGSGGNDRQSPSVGLFPPISRVTRNRRGSAGRADTTPGFCDSTMGKMMFRLREQVHQLMQRYGDETLSFRKGEIMYDRMNSTGDSIFYILHGSATWEDSDVEEVRKFVIINNTTEHGMYEAEGNFFGILEMVTPASAFNDTVLRAWSDVVTVRRLSIQKTWELHVPLVVADMSDRSACTLYTKLAHDMLLKCFETERRLERLSSLALSRHDTDKHYGQTVKKATRNALMTEYHLPPSEQLLMSCDAKHVVEGLAHKIKGKLHLFSSWIVWAPRKGDHVAMMTRNIMTFEEFGREMVFTIDSQQLPAPEGDRSPIRGVRALTPEGKDKGSSGAASAASSSFYAEEGNNSRLSGLGKWVQSTVKSIQDASAKSLGSQRESSYNEGGNRSSNSAYKARRHLARESIRIKFPNLALLRQFKIQAMERKSALSKAAGIHWQMRREARVQMSSKGVPWGEFGYVLNGDLEQDQSDKEYAVLKDIFELAERYHYQVGETIVSAYTNNQALLHITKGTAHVVSPMGAILQEYTEGEIMGVETFLDQSSIGARNDIKAHTPVEILSISRQAVDHLVTQKPLAGARIYRNMCIHCAVKLQMDLLSMRAWQSY